MKNHCTIEGKEDGQNTIPNAVPNTENTKDTNGKVYDRYYEYGDSIFFTKVGLYFHKSFVKKYEGMTFPQARRSMRGWYTHRQKDEIIHYLKKTETILPLRKKFKN